MPVNIGEVITGAGDRISRNGFVSTVIGNPIYTSLMIVCVLGVLTLWVFREVETYDESVYFLTVRLMAYASLLTLGIVFLHDKAITDDLRGELHSNTVSEILGEDTPNTEFIPVNIPSGL